MKICTATLYDIACMNDQVFQEYLLQHHGSQWIHKDAESAAACRLRSRLQEKSQARKKPATKKPQQKPWYRIF